MAVRSKRLAGPVDTPSGGTTVLYTVPAGETAVVRSFTVCNAGAVAAPVVVLIDPAGADPQRSWWRGNVPSGGTSVLPYLVLNPGDEVAITNFGGAGIITTTMAGSELEGAAD